MTPNFKSESELELCLLISDSESEMYKLKSLEFRQRFGVPENEKLVTYYSATYWPGKLFMQGWLYLTIQRLFFYAYFLGKEKKIVIRWVDVTNLSRTNSLLLPDNIAITTRDGKVCR